jgi:hypothetical protein
MALAFFIPPRLAKAIRARKARPAQQFGQIADATTGNGKGACTQTALQSLIWIWTKVWYSLDHISALAGYPGYAASGRGMNAAEVSRVLSELRLPYRRVLDMEYFEIMRAGQLGPMLVAVRYGDWPRKKGLPAGRNGFAIENGATQLVGFDGAHMTLDLGPLLRVFDSVSHKELRREVYAHEPNHGSTLRPEKPPFDKITVAQHHRAFESLRTLGRSTLAFIPTRELPA